MQGQDPNAVMLSIVYYLLVKSPRNSLILNADNVITYIWAFITCVVWSQGPAEIWSYASNVEASYMDFES